MQQISSKVLTKVSSQVPQLTAPVDTLQVELALWSLHTVLAHIPVSKSGWWAGVKSGRYPTAVRLSSKRVAWRVADIRALIASL